MKRSSPRGFTLIEMVVVVAIVIALAALTVSIASYALRNANMRKAQNEIHAMQLACEAYKIDHGTYPQNADTDNLDPRLDVDASSSKYQKASIHLYSCLTGDFLPAGAPDGKPEGENKPYGNFERRQLSIAQKGAAAGTVLCIQDPFGQPYGYSTAGNRTEAAYRSAARSNPNTARPLESKGYNPTYDIWSTCGSTAAPKWLNNWRE